jgi:uncharacterized protein with PQ loop repeat
MELAQILGWIATILFSVMYIPQMYKTIESGSVKDVSVWMFLVSLLANIIAFCYATLIHQSPLQIKYVIAMIAILIYLIIYWTVKHRSFYLNKGNNDATNIK